MLTTKRYTNSQLKSITNEHQAASKDLEGYLSNPINAYRLIKRLHNDWMTYEQTVQQNDIKESKENAKSLNVFHH